MIGAKRWFNGEFFWVSLSGEGHATATRIEHYWKDGDGPEQIIYTLEKVSTKGSTSTYKYKVGEDLELLDSFKIFAGEVLLFEYIVDDLSRDSLTESKKNTISSPRGPLESRSIEVETFRLWRRDLSIFPGFSGINVYPGFVDGVVADGLFPFYEGKYGIIYIDRSFSELHSFKGVLNPALKSPSEINDLLGDPESLFLSGAFTLYFEGEYGDEDDWSLVGVFSDGTTAWKEYYNFDEVFYDGSKTLRPRPDGNSYVSSGVFLKENAGSITPLDNRRLSGHYEDSNGDRRISIDGQYGYSGSEKTFLHYGEYSFSASIEGALPAPESDNFSRSIEDRFAIPSKAYNIFGGL